MHGGLQLRVAPGDHRGRVVAHLDVGRDALGLDRPLPVDVEEAAARGHETAAVDEGRGVPGAHQTAPGLRAHQRTNLLEAEQVGQQVAAGAGALVDHHDLGPEERGHRLSPWLAVARARVEVAGELAVEHVHDVVGRRAAAVVALVDDRALAVLLGVVHAVEVLVAALPGVGEPDIRQPAPAHLVDPGLVRGHPRPAAQDALVRDRFHEDVAGPIHGRRRRHRQGDGAPGGALQQLVGVGRRP